MTVNDNREKLLRSRSFEAIQEAENGFSGRSDRQGVPIYGRFKSGSTGADFGISEHPASAGKAVGNLPDLRHVADTNR